jgi:SAM-dependent methyltransferase
MKEIDSNSMSWNMIAENQYGRFKEQLIKGKHSLNAHVANEIGDITGKKVIHLQCNTGADSILLSRMGADVTGVDISRDNVFYAGKLAKELEMKNVRFIESDIMTLSKAHKNKYDIVFTTEGVLTWLPDLNIWGKTIRELLSDGGFLYVFDSHPFFFCFDEQKLDDGIYDIKYPYFEKSPDVSDSLGGYSSEQGKSIKAYCWMHTVSDIINSLASNGMHIEYFHEFTENFFDSGNGVMKPDIQTGLYHYEFNQDKFPMTFSLKASVYR